MVQEIPAVLGASWVLILGFGVRDLPLQVQIQVSRGAHRPKMRLCVRAWRSVDITPRAVEICGPVITVVSMQTK